MSSNFCPQRCWWRVLVTEIVSNMPKLSPTHIVTNIDVPWQLINSLIWKICQSWKSKLYIRYRWRNNNSRWRNIKYDIFSDDVWVWNVLREKNYWFSSKSRSSSFRNSLIGILNELQTQKSLLIEKLIVWFEQKKFCALIKNLAGIVKMKFRII